MMPVLKLVPEATVVLVVDIQERLFSVMPEQQQKDLQRAATVLLEAAAVLGVQAIGTEQYPEKLGGTLPAIADKLGALSAPRIPKLDFSALREPAFEAALQKTKRRHVVLLGMETHICVFQTARDLCARGFTVHVPIDGVASRRDDHRQAGLDLCRAAGATLTTTETVLFDWLGRAGSEAFKQLSKLIK